MEAWPHPGGRFRVQERACDGDLEHCHGGKDRRGFGVRGRCVELALPWTGCVLPTDAESPQEHLRKKAHGNLPARRGPSLLASTTLRRCPGG